jgi:response regulator RpfG family c-di-GMP phosphodiesterase
MTIKYKTCLLIDDNYIDNFITTKMLEGSSFAKEVIAMQSPEAAIEALRLGTVTPDVIFLDIRMPIMSGFEFLEEYDKLSIVKDNIKIFMLSSSLDPRDIKQSIVNKHVIQFIHKPITAKALDDLLVS